MFGDECSRLDQPLHHTIAGQPPGWQAESMSEYTELHDAIRAFSAERDWGRFHDPKSLLIAMMGEVGEVSELLQWLPAEQSRRLVATEPLHGRMAEELSDVFIYLIQLADACAVDLVPAARAKRGVRAKVSGRGVPRTGTGARPLMGRWRPG